MAKKRLKQYLIIRNVVAYLQVISYIFQITSFYLFYQKKTALFLVDFLMINVSLIKTLSIFIYLLSIYLFGQYQKAIGKIEQEVDFFPYFGYTKLCGFCLLMWIHPLYFLKETGSGWYEEFIDKDNVPIEFERNLNQLLFVVAFTIQFWFTCFVLLENTMYSNTRSQRICSMFRVENNVKFIVKCLLNQHGEVFVPCLILGGVFYFSTIIITLEQGFVDHILSRELPEEVLLQNFKKASVLVTYQNTLWYVLITMTTVGYGDMVVRTNLTRVFIFLVAMFGAMIFPVLVISIKNMFQISRNEEMSIAIIEQVRIKRLL